MTFAVVSIYLNLTLFRKDKGGEGLQQHVQCREIKTK